MRLSLEVAALMNMQSEGISVAASGQVIVLTHYVSGCNFPFCTMGSTCNKCPCVKAVESQ